MRVARRARAGVRSIPGRLSEAQALCHPAEARLWPFHAESATPESIASDKECPPGRTRGAVAPGADRSVRATAV